jgi:hypothetical protein
MTTMKTMMFLAGVGLALGVSAAQAQTSSSMTSTSTGTTRTHFIVPGGGYGAGYGSVYGEDPATTPIQGWAYGYARLIDSSGKGLVNAADAAVQLSEARRREMENWKQSIEISLEVQKIVSDARAAARGRPLTPAEYVRLSQMGRPRRLTPSQLNLLTGELAWPIVLDDSPFASYRQVLDQIFVQRTEHGRLGYAEYSKGEQTAQAMIEMLRARIHDFTPGDYMAARRFLESVAYELRLPTSEGDEMRTADIRPLR